MKRRSGLLTFISVLFIIVGVVFVIITLLGAIGGIAIAVVGLPAAGVALIITVFLFCLQGILQFAAGVMGAQQRNIGGCNAIGIVLLVLELIGIVLTAVLGSFNSIGWLTWINLALIILYLVGVGIARARRRSPSVNV